MFSRIHSRLGTAGLIVAIVALVAALAGGAYAASGLNKQQKKQVRSIAKSESKKWSKKFSQQFAQPGPAGATGATGPAGPVGPAGAKGDNGNDGAAGKSVEVSGTASGCAEGGATVQVEGEEGTAQEICNGAEGAAGNPWAPESQLPTGATETGTWAMAFNEEGATPISFAVPLAAPLDSSHALIVGEGEAAPAECDDGEGEAASAANPEADSGYLCVFVVTFEGGGAIGAVADPTTFASGAAKSGAILLLGSGGADFAVGTFAVTG
jgi:hypothetical protein